MHDLKSKAQSVTFDAGGRSTMCNQCVEVKVKSKCSKYKYKYKVQSMRFDAGGRSTKCSHPNKAHCCDLDCCLT